MRSLKGQVTSRPILVFVIVDDSDFVVDVVVLDFVDIVTVLAVAGAIALALARVVAVAVGVGVTVVAAVVGVFVVVVVVVACVGCGRVDVGCVFQSRLRLLLLSLLLS